MKPQNGSFDEAPSDKPRRRWIRFSVRTLFIFVAVLGVSLSWVGMEIQQRRRERVVIAWVEKQGGDVNVAFKGSFRPTDMFFSNSFLGVKVRQVDLSGTKVSDLSPLTELNRLEWLGLNGTPISDLSILAKLRSLRWLYLDFTELNDLSPLAELRSLERLTLFGADVSNAQVETLKQALPNCCIEYVPREEIEPTNNAWRQSPASPTSPSLFLHNSHVSIQ